MQKPLDFRAGRKGAAPRYARRASGKRALGQMSNSRSTGEDDP